MGMGAGGGDEKAVIREDTKSMKTTYRYLEFELAMFQCKMLKTKKWECFNKKHRSYLGEVKWQARWRQYCFYPDGGTIFSAGCMTDIIHFIRQLMDEYKTKKELP